IRPGVALRPSRSGSSPMAISISRTARSMRGTSTRCSGGYVSSRGTKLVSNSRRLLSSARTPTATGTTSSTAFDPGARRLERVIEEHRPSHGTHSARNGGYGRSAPLNLLEAYVPHQSPAISLMNPHVHHHSSLLYVLGADHLPAAQGDDEYVPAG